MDMNKCPPRPIQVIELDYEFDNTVNPLIAKKVHNLWFYNHINYLDFRDLWLIQNGLCARCKKELNFWNNDSHEYNFINGVIYCYSCRNKV